MVHSVAVQRECSAADGIEQIFARVFRELRPRTALARVRVEIRPFANANSWIQWHEGQLRVKISDTLIGAPEGVHESLAHILIAKLFRKPIVPRHQDRFRRYLSRRETVETLERVKRERGRKSLLPPVGQTYNLLQMFEDINLRFFHGLMARPEVGWSVRVSWWVLGHYDAAHHAIVISRLLDRPEVPLVVVEYVMYHEMLHLRFPVERRGARRCVHSAEFRRVEEQFPQYKEAVEWIRNMGKVLQRGSVR